MNTKPSWMELDRSLWDWKQTQDEREGRKNIEKSEESCSDKRIVFETFEKWLW